MNKAPRLLRRRALPGVPAFAPPPDAPRDSLRHLDRLLRKQWKRYRKRLKCCQLQSSEEAVHEFRVETRRLASLLELLRPFLEARCLGKAEAVLKCHLDIFKETRDTHVQLIAVAKMRDGNPAAKSFYEYLVDREARCARKARKNLKRIKPKRVARMIRAFRTELKRWRAEVPEAQSRALLFQGVSTAFERTLESRDRIDPARTDTIHRTRVCFKKFRYMVEMLGDYVPGSRRLCQAMHRYQTRMGVIQDNEVLLSQYDKFLRKHRVQAAPTRRFRDQLLRRRKTLVAAYLKSADEILKFWAQPLDGTVAWLSIKEPDSSAIRPNGKLQ